jgi:protein O-GlcNAc transferase
MRFRNGYVTYGCFNSLSKIGLHVVSVWAEILRRTPASRLVMKNYAFADETSRRLYEDYFAQCGIEPARVNLLGPSPHGAVLEHYAEVDIALDPFPYNGGTTTCEALAMGVPVVTLRGDRFVSRVGATILRNAGLDSLIAWSESEYIEKALVLAAQPELAAEMRTGMRARLARSTLCDCTGFTRKLEHAYRDIWRRWCALQSGA